MALGAAYRAELAHELRALGYEIAADKGSFRISQVPRDLERHFSKRRAQIEAVMNERGTRSARAAEVAARGRLARASGTGVQADRRADGDRATTTDRRRPGFATAPTLPTFMLPPPTSVVPSNHIVYDVNCIKYLFSIL